MKCKACARSYHWCPSCGFDRDLEPLSLGYCGYECLIKSDGPPVDPDWWEDPQQLGPASRFPKPPAREVRARTYTKTNNGRK